MKSYFTILFLIIFSLIIGADVSCSQNNKDASKEQAETQNNSGDSSYNNNKMGRNMSGSGMMGNNMNGGSMMGNGMMMNQGNNSGNQGGSWVAPESADKLKNPVAGIVSATKKGQGIFNTQCSVCHGEKGLGDGIAGASLHPHPANLTADSVQNQSDGAIYWKITTGNSPMASYKNSLSDKERWYLVNYIRKLGKK